MKNNLRLLLKENYLTKSVNYIKFKQKYISSLIRTESYNKSTCLNITNKGFINKIYNKFQSTKSFTNSEFININHRDVLINSQTLNSNTNSNSNTQIQLNKETGLKHFYLQENFINNYVNKEVNFGFNGLGELVYRRTYSRTKESDGKNEEWYETVKRVVEGTFSMKINHISKEKLEQLDKNELNKDAEIMFDKIFNFKFLPPGRGLWAMGTKITETKGLFAALNNCAFVSTKPDNELDVQQIIRPYLFMMDSSMLGIGVGFDTKATEKNIKLFKPTSLPEHKNDEIIIEDSREGWVTSVGVLLESFFSPNKSLPRFDYSKIRPAGSPLKTFGGVSCGFKVLHELHDCIIELLTKHCEITTVVTSRLIVDLMNLIGRAVIAGNIRRSAEIALGECNDESFINLKNYKINPERIAYGWVSNNSIYAEIGMDYKKFENNIAENGEPGFLWLENMKNYSRMCDYPDYSDNRASGGNPCLEQTLESYEMCCLVETFPTHHENLEEFLDTLKYAFMYTKIVTLGMTNWPETNKIITNNRRIGVSMTGIAQFISKFNLNTLKIFCTEGYAYLRKYDKEISKKLGVNTSIKITSIKPSGTVSLLGGATPGIHLPLSRFYIRRVRLKSSSPLVQELKEKGYHVEPDVTQPQETVVVSFPVDAGKGVKTLKESCLWEQLSLAAFMQKYWADNQVSCTVTFDKTTESNQLSSALDYFQYQLKGISFLPALENSTPYPQMPYEKIDEETYFKLLKNIKSYHLNSKLKDEQLERESDKFCDGDKCEI